MHVWELDKIECNFLGAHVVGTVEVQAVQLDNRFTLYFFWLRNVVQLRNSLFKFGDFVVCLYWGFLGKFLLAHLDFANVARNFISLILAGYGKVHRGESSIRLGSGSYNLVCVESKALGPHESALVLSH